MKSKFIVLLSGLALAFGAGAYSTETVDGVTWKYTTTYLSSESRTVAIVGAADGSTTPAVPTSVTSLTVPEKLGGYPVRQIGDSAFNGCSALRSLTVPTNVTQIATSALNGCTAVTAFSMGAKTKLAPVYTVSGDWIANADTVDGLSAYKTKNFSYSGTDSSTMTLSAPKHAGTLTIRYRGRQYYSSNSCVVNIGGVSYSLDFNTSWQRRSFDVPAGASVSFTYYKNYSYGSYSYNYEYIAIEAWPDDGLLSLHDFFPNLKQLAMTGEAADVVSSLVSGFTTVTNLAMDVGTTFSGVSYTVSGDWIANAATVDGLSAYKTKNFSYSGADSSTMTLSAPVKAATLTIRYRGCRYSSSNSCVVNIGGVSYSLDFNTSWQRRSFDVPAGASVSFVYKKNYYYGDYNNNYEYVVIESYQQLPEVSVASLFPNLTVLEVQGDASTAKDGKFSGCLELNRVAYSGNVALATVLPDAYTVVEYVTVTSSGALIADDWSLDCATMFAGCAALKSVDIPSSAFKDCCSLTSVSVSEKVSAIGANAFDGCTALSSVMIPNAVTSVGAGAFANCGELTAVTISGATVRNFDSVFVNCPLLTSVTLADGTTEIAANAFKGNAHITSVSLPSTVTNIGASAFEGCANLAMLSIPSSVTAIGASAFSGCRSLSSVTIPVGVSTIPANAFKDCVSLTEITIPSNVTTVGANAFDGCTGLGTVTIPKTVTTVGAGAFANCTGLTRATVNVTALANFSSIFSDCTQLSNVTVLNDATSVPANAFKGNSQITAVSLPSTVTNIGASAFEGCANLAMFSIPSSVTAIGASAFSGCRALPSVTIPDGVTKILSDTFRSCESLQSLTIPTNVENVAGTAFMGCTAVTNLSMGVGTKLGLAYDVRGDWIPNAATVDGLSAYKTRNFSYSGSGSSTMTLSTLSHAGTLTIRYRGCRSSTSNSCVVNIGGAAYSLDFSTSWQSRSFTVPAGASVSFTYYKNYYYGDYSSNYEYIAIENYSPGCVANWFPNLTALTLWGDASLIEQGLFDGCSKVSSISYSGTLALRTLLPRSYAALSSITFPATATCICDSAFAGCTNITDLVIPSTVTNIGASAFQSCTSLVRIEVPTSVRAINGNTFNGCSSLQSVILPDAVTSVGDGAFSGCGAINYMRFPEGWVFRSADLTRMGVPDSYVESFKTSDNNWIVMGTTLIAYVGDANVTELTIPDGIDIIDDEALAELYTLQTVTFAGSERIIGRKAFYDCTDLEYVDLPETVESIGESAFRNCTWIDEVYFPAELKAIGKHAFRDCTELLTCAFYEGLGEIGDYAFANCWRLISASIPHSVTNLGTTVFTGCENITGVVTPSNLRTLSAIFPSAYPYIEQVIIPEGETEIMNSMFSGCSSLDTIEIPNTVTNIGNSAFQSCTSLQSQALPDSVISLGSSAFAYCSKLELVALSKNLVALNDYTFRECDLLTSLVVPASVRRLGSGLFYCGHSPIPVTAMRDVYFLSDAPLYDGGAYNGTTSALKTHVVKGTRGWDGNVTSKSLPRNWIGRSITYWTPNLFEVTFDPNGGTFAPYSAEQITDTTYALPDEKPTRAGYAFAGWWTQPEGGGEVISTTIVHATRAHTLYAHWEAAQTIEILFNPNGGTVEPDSGYYTAGATHVKFPVPTRRGYAFAGWWTGASGGENITESDRVPLVPATLYAHWTPITYFVEFHSNNGQDEVVTQRFTFDVRGVLRANTFKYADRNFIGWALSAGGSVVHTDGDSVLNWRETQDDKVVLYAKWDGARYAVRFDENGGSGDMTNQTILVNATKTLDANRFTRTGYTFQGWALTATGAVVYKNGASVNNLAGDDGNVTLYAKWKANTYVVRYHYNFGSSTVTKDQTMTWDVAQALKYVNSGLGWKNPSGCSFLGWGTAAAADFAKYGNGEKVKNLASEQGAVVHLYAVWMNASQYAVRFHRNDGGADATVQQRYAVNERKHLVWKDSQIGWTRVGYTFLGWAKSAASATPNYLNGETVENLATGGKTLELYAVWKPGQVPYKVRFHRNCGDNATHDESFVFGKEQALLWMDSQLKWTRAGSVFLGWGTSAGSSVAMYANGAKVLDLATAKNGVVHLYAIWAQTSDSYFLKLCRRFDGSDKVMATVRMPKGRAVSIPWKDSQLGWNLQNTSFMGWATSDGTRVAKYANGEKVTDLVGAGRTLSLYAVWRPTNTYVVRFHRMANASDATVVSQWFYRGTAAALAWQASGLGWTPSGLTFCGWARSALSTTIAYANGASVKDLAAAGATLDLYAVWQYKTTFNRNVGDGMTATRTYYVNQRAQIPWLDSELKFTRAGYTFRGWATTPNGAVRYANGEKSARTVNIFSSGATLYAIWSEPAKSSNDAIGVTSSASGPQPQPSTSAFTSGLYRGTFADGSGTFDLLVDEFGADGVAAAYLVATTEDGVWSEECEATVAGETLLLSRRQGVCVLTRVPAAPDEVVMQTIVSE